LSIDRRAVRFLAPLAALAAAATGFSCGDGSPVGIDTANLELILIQGDGQGAEPGTTLPVSFQVKAQSTGNGSPVEDARVVWLILEGDDGSLDSSLTRTDSLGLASARLTLGPSLGPYRVQAEVKGMLSPPVEFTADAIRAPVLTDVPAGPIRSGETITIRGSDFSLHPRENVVTFSRIRAEVMSSGDDELRVQVPPCLLARDYDLRVQRGALISESMVVEVLGTADALTMDVGEDRVLEDSMDSECVHIPGGGNSLYLVVPHSTAQVSGAEYGFSLVSVTGDGEPLGAPGFWRPGQTPWRLPAQASGSLSSQRDEVRRVQAQDRWDEHLRTAEAELVARGRRESETVPEDPHRSSSERVVPEVGDRRSFQVLNRQDQFEKVTARVRYVSERAVLYMDEKVPPGGYTDRDLADLAYEFDVAIHPVVTTAFGEESDLDGNDRIIILFTPAVNRLTQPGSDGYVGGFFYGLDLLKGRSGSDEGEIFYAMVPDPQGEEGPSIGRFTVLTVIPSILAHEFEHMVHFNRRMLVGQAEATDALWLSEALAQMAEDLVGQAYQGASNLAKAAQYQSGNWARAQRFLENPSQVSVLASLSPGTLAERGAGWLLLKQLHGAPGQEGLLHSLVASTSTGVANLTAQTGESWPELMANWVGALFLDGTGVPVRPELIVPGVNLRMALAESDGSYPLRALVMGNESTLFSGMLWSSAPDYFIITPPSGGVTLSVGGPMGGPPDGAMGLRTLLVRLQ
jgi:hypothetical protein